jgi:hypothetical protein
MLFCYPFGHIYVLHYNLITVLEVCSLQVHSFATVVFIGTTLFALQQLSGINSVFYFSSTVFRSVGVPSSLANICMGIANLSGKPIEAVLFSYSVIFVYGSNFGMFATRFCRSYASNGQTREKSSSCRKLLWHGERIYCTCKFIRHIVYY